MNTRDTNADILIQEIDAGCVKPMTRSVVRVLHYHMHLDDPLQAEAVSAFDRGAQTTEMSEISTRFWTKIDRLGVADQSGLRLSNCLTRPDKAVDWELAEYLIFWARQQGLSEQQIIHAFRVYGAGS